ncbi:MAG: PAS domain S-box protein [Myxococcales bacterium]|nr:PAS domain S-box protein [Myxococcales bacterium]
MIEVTSVTDELGPSSIEGLYRHLLDTAPDAIVVVGASGLITLVNQQTEALFGYARSDLVGRPLEVLLPERFRAGHRAHMMAFAERPGARPMGSGLTLFGRRADGSELAIEVSLSPVTTSRGGLVSAAIRDVTERRRMEATAKLAADRLASAVESTQDAFALFDAEERLVLCNSVYRRLLGSVTGALIGRSYEETVRAWMQDLAFPSESDRVRFLADGLAIRRVLGAGFDVRTRDGRSLRITIRRTLEGGIVKTVWDLTDDVRLAEELREARAAAEAASDAKSEFLSSMSHELRTPLNAILGFAQLLRRDKKEPLSHRHRERVDQILKGGEHLLHLIDDILDLARIEAGGVSISTEPVGVREALQEVAATLAPAAARADVALTVVDPPDDVPMLSVDRTRFIQILMNFGSNALKYNRPGGTARLEVSSVEGDPRPLGVSQLRVLVRDTGPGIAIEQQGRLFQPFYRAGQETGPIEGTGIGLVITRRLARLMGGDVGFRSEPGRGSEFWVDLPTHSTGAPSSALRHGSRPRLSGGAGGLVLYVEDNPANVAFMRDALAGYEGLELITAPTAELGIEIARERLPSVVFMDINLPGMSGLDAMRRLREMPETADIPVVALTAAASERDRRRGEQAGFYRYLTKPVRIEELETTLDSLLAPPSTPPPRST